MPDRGDVKVKDKTGPASLRSPRSDSISEGPGLAVCNSSAIRLLWPVPAVLPAAHGGAVLFQVCRW